MNEYNNNDKVYVDLKEIRQRFQTYCRGCRSLKALIERKQYTDYFFGIVRDGGSIQVTEKLSCKYGTIFVAKTHVMELFDESKPAQEVLPAPPLLIDDDLAFKDEDGVEYDVEMRGERTPDEIFFKAKDIERVFAIKALLSNTQLDHSSYRQPDHYQFFVTSDVTNQPSEEALTTSKSYNVWNRRGEKAVTTKRKEMYFTYTGLLKVINSSRSGVGHKFQKWIEEIVFAAMLGTTEQKVEVARKILNVDADHLRAIMTKSATKLSCLYLIKTSMKDEGKCVYKYGFTDNVHRRFGEHITKYGDKITLETFVFIPVSDLSKAETDFKNSVSKYKFKLEGHKELVSLCDEAYTNMRTILKTISENYCGNIKEQMLVYESQLKELRFEYELKLREKDLEISNAVHKYELSMKDNQILQMRVELLELKKVRH